MCETFAIAYTTLGDQPADLELMLDSRLYPKKNIEVWMSIESSPNILK